MENKMIVLLALDSLLLEIDDNYEEVESEHVQLIKSKIYESYGFKVTSSKEEAEKIVGLMIKDIKDFRDKIISELEV